MLRDFDLLEDSNGDFHLHMAENTDGKKTLVELNDSFFENISSNEDFLNLLKMSHIGGKEFSFRK